MPAEPSALHGARGCHIRNLAYWKGQGDNFPTVATSRKMIQNEGALRLGQQLFAKGRQHISVGGDARRGRGLQPLAHDLGKFRHFSSWPLAPMFSSTQLLLCFSRNLFRRAVIRDPPETGDFTFPRSCQLLSLFSLLRD